MIETEFSDKMIVAVIKMHFPKMKPQVVSYQKYKDFHNETFLDSVRHELDVQRQFLTIFPFPTICTEIFIKHAKKRERYDITTSCLLIMKFLRQSRQEKV